MSCRNTLDLTVKPNEVVLKGDGEWLHFVSPYLVLTAEKREDVLPALREAEHLVQTRNWHAAGFLSYESAPAFDAAFPTRPADDFPYLWFGLYGEPACVMLPSPGRSNLDLAWHPAIDRETYDAAITAIKEHIAAGDTYQVNYTMRLRTHFRASAWDFFLRLIQRQNEHAAYLDTGRYVICSASPELFFRLDGDRITCRPMKGTAKRGRTTIEDAERSARLKHSEKDRAENVMIVDMIRNDLGRIAETGTVCVPHLFETERYATLWQMTSTVTARTSHSVTEIMTALFPCASITGAPKVSTMNIIAGLESAPRRIYTGTLGYIAPDRKAKFNVAIRTVLIDRETSTAEYGAGGGIVWDSDPDDEYAEALLKARLLTGQPPDFSLLETMLWTPGEGFFLRERHTARMLDSADYFGISMAAETLDTYLTQMAGEFETPQRVRVLLSQSGELSCETRAVVPGEQARVLQACLAPQPVDSSDVFLYHKTTRRDVYDSARLGQEEYDDVLLYNERGELTEFTIGNLVVEMDGQLFTPPISCGVLPGTFRRHLLETGRIQERTVHVENLQGCREIFRINSVQKWQKAQLHTRG